jgi:NADH:ubiquinone oxidoreductase subunit 6 (subunit J)
MSAVLFFIAAIAAIVGAIGVVALRNPLYAVLALVCHLISLAALFLLLRAEFVAAAQVVVYAGAVMVLYVFVVAYVGGGDEIAAGSALRILGPIFALALAIELFIAMLGSALKGISGKGAHYVLGFGTPEQIGKQFLTVYLFPFEIASLLLLVAAIGAVVLARRRRGLDEEDVDEIARLLATPRPSYTGTIAEGVGVRKVLDLIEEAHGGAIEIVGGGSASEAVVGGSATEAVVGGPPSETVAGGSPSTEGEDK